MKQITVYSQDNCNFSIATRHLLKYKGFDFQEIGVDDNPGLRKELELKSGQSSLPQIFVEAYSIGGYTDLEKAIENGELARLLGSL